MKKKIIGLVRLCFIFVFCFAGTCGGTGEGVAVKYYCPESHQIRSMVNEVRAAMVYLTTDPIAKNDTSLRDQVCGKLQTEMGGRVHVRNGRHSLQRLQRAAQQIQEMADLELTFQECVPSDHSERKPDGTWTTVHHDCDTKKVVQDPRYSTVKDLADAVSELGTKVNQVCYPPFTLYVDEANRILSLIDTVIIPNGANVYMMVSCPPEEAFVKNIKVNGRGHSVSRALEEGIASPSESGNVRKDVPESQPELLEKRQPGNNVEASKAI